MDTSLAKTIVDESPFLSELHPAAAEVLAASVRPRVLRPKEYWARQGDPARALTWLHSGMLSVFFETTDGSTMPYRIVWPNEVSCLGLPEATEYPASSTALTPVKYYWATQEVLERALHEVPELAYSLLCYISRQEERLAVWSSRLLSLHVRARLRLVLARMALHTAQPHDAGRLLDFAVTSRILSIVAHVSRDEAGRALRELLHEGLVERLQGRRLLVPDVDRLLGPSLLELAAKVGLAAAGQRTRK